ncbi:STAS/SEC14 domain-containing protein [Salinisphaera sp. SPP-AMP-43]|uniref:STAS/SEC14 domain-containing protein n=1 Tax=Salinisphaera sp. SPP-AMP-43 TaxID=3121288 RepID=UPI003C6DCCCE
MLRIAPFPSDADHVVPLEIDGEVGSQDFANVLSDIEQRLQQHDTLRLYIEIKSMGGMSASTVFSELKDAIKHWDRFDKLAVVTDVEGVRTATTVLDKLAPKMDCETYRFDGRESARQWVIG